MNQIATLIAGLVKSPASLKGLVGELEVLVRSAGSRVADLQRATDVIKVGTAALQSWNGKNGATREATLAVAPATQFCHANGSVASRDNGVAITAAVSLLTVMGAVAVVGTVSVIALANGQDQSSGQPPPGRST
jgi:hypothetical protein